MTALLELCRLKPAAPNPIDVYVGSRLRLARTKHGKTQATLARIVGVSAHQIHKYESGETRLSVAMLLRFCEILDLSSAWFFEELETTARRRLEPDAVDIWLTSPESARLANGLARLTPHLRSKVLALVWTVLPDCEEDAA